MITHLGDVLFRLSTLGVTSVDEVECSPRVFSALSIHPAYVQSSREQYMLLKTYGINDVNCLVFEYVKVKREDNHSDNLISFYQDGQLKTTIEVQI